MSSEVTKEMKLNLLRILDRPLRLMDTKITMELREAGVNCGTKESFMRYIEETRKFFHENGCETKTQHFILKNYYPKKGSWKFHSRKTSGLIWLQYDEDRFRCKKDSMERYWVGIPKHLAFKIIETNQFPVN
jgi:hypothetical protein